MAQDLDLEERSSKGSNRGGKSGGRGKNSRVGEGRKGENREVAISKALSKLLRHSAADEGLDIDSEGFARVGQVMQWSRLKSLQVTFGDIHTACTTNAKQRFSLKPHPAYPTPDPDTPSHWLIRANQGHSIALSSAALLTPITLEVGNVPSTVVHGTYYALYPTIVASSGLSKMRRNHIHFSTGLPGGEEGTVSGMRADAELLIYVDIRKSLAEGVLWWLSDNGVVLTEGDKDGFLGTRYWSRVEGRTGEVGTLWKDGEWVADLPEGAKGKKVPVDKMLVGKRGVERSRGSRAHGRRGTGKEMKELDTLGEGEGLGMSVP